MSRNLEAVRENFMRVSHRLGIAILGLLMSACAGMPAQPAPEVRRDLAPTGRLRVGVLPQRPWSMVVDPATGETKGVGYELGKELARRLSVPLEVVVLSNSGEFVEALKTGKADVVLSNATPARAKDVDFTPSMLDIEQGFLIRAEFPASGWAEIDRPGVRVGVGAGSTSESILSRELKQASLVRVPTVRSAAEMLATRALDVYASNKATLPEMLGESPGARMLDTAYGVEHMALGIPKGRDRAMAYLRQFADEARSARLVERAAERAGLRGGAVPKAP
jgi:polar amino acid transport system substrate-binding protein